ncbi:fructosamine-3-kinase [Exophiala viscosa]|uniref:protein-ribulosamine 3-kinase n=1 Tax=Exophiala viscosa TaxID=2486360 RepID=A0AAN6E085_9EURO|nr:fructosamine-3-kinase [Exophiala viscosa]KAI1624274.1 fructosamine-3-kinase [Exophiala viscosa]
MPSTIDPAILRALSLDSSAKISTHGGSGFASTFRISTPSASVFVKTSSSNGAAVMFEGEHASLNAIHNAVPSLCPKSFAWGKLDKGGHFLATEFLDLGGRNRSGGGGSGMSLAQKLAKLHSTPAPTPEGHDSPRYGFPVSTCCGDTPQDNTSSSSWADFFAKRRLLAILERGEKNNGRDEDLRRTVERTINEVVPRLLGDGHLGGKEGIKPVVIHGDLWSGNKSRGSFVGRDTASPDEPGPVEDLVFDPSSCYAHNEYDFGIMNMFGGFGAGFWKEYHSTVPKTEPESEYEDRVALYESYHHLNHYAIFGGGYKSGAVRILKGLLRKYGEK